MTKFQSAYNSFMAFLGDIANAAAVVGAIQAGRQPNPENLRRLGISPRAYMNIGHG